MPRNGRVVVVIVLAIALSLGGLGSWWLVRARPSPGEFIDVLALPDGGAVVIRRERGASNDFVEVRGPHGLRWRGLIPPYAGTPGTIATAATANVMTVRVIRGGHPFLFAFDTATGGKLASFDLIEEAPPDPHGYTLPGLATVSAGARSIEVLGRPGGGARLILVELDQRRLAWRVDLPAPPDEVWIDGAAVVARSGAALSAWAVESGAPMAAPSPMPAGTTAATDVYFTAAGYGRGGAITVPVAATAVPPRPYHHSGGRIWIVEPRRLTVLDDALAPVAMITP